MLIFNTQTQRDLTILNQARPFRTNPKLFRVRGVKTEGFKQNKIDFKKMNSLSLQENIQLELK